MNRKPVQIAASQLQANGNVLSTLYVLCSDGTIWGQRSNSSRWYRLSDIPPYQDSKPFRTEYVMEGDTMSPLDKAILASRAGKGIME